MEFSNERRLTSRLRYLLESKQKVTFLLGSALSNSPTGRGVPMVAEIIGRTRSLYSNPADLGEFDAAIKEASDAGQYQAAMRFVIETRGMPTLNEVIRSSVLCARSSVDTHLSDDQIEADTEGWFLTPGLEAIGKLLTSFRSSFSAPILTTNFDPLVEVAIRKNCGHATSVVLPSDGNFYHVTAGTNSSNIVHLHGFWRSGDMLHTPNQLSRERPHLNGALRSLLRQSVLVVMGYGGWSDVFTRTLVKVISEHAEPLDVLWCFYEAEPEKIVSSHQGLISSCEQLIGQRLVLYSGIDCHKFLPRLFEEAAGHAASSPFEDSSEAKVAVSLLSGSTSPPSSPVWVGRADELKKLLEIDTGVVAIYGFGGVGKSTLAAKSLLSKIDGGECSHWAWVDCREQENTIVTHMLHLIAGFSGGAVKPLQVSDVEVVGLLVDYLVRHRAVIVFDNVDSYVDLEEKKLTGALQILVSACEERGISSLVILTCRPQIKSTGEADKGIHLEGLVSSDIRELFALRLSNQEVPNENYIDLIRKATAGNSLQINLMITQILGGRMSVEDLVAKIRTGVSTEIEFSILDEIWSALNDKQRTILRYLCESPGPQHPDRIENYLGSSMTPNRFRRSLSALVSIDIVIERPGDRGLLLELHPLVRNYILNKYTRDERRPFLSRIILVCETMMDRFRARLAVSTDDIYNYWADKVELSVQNDDSEGAIRALNEVGGPLVDSSHSEEFVRLCSVVADAFKFNVADSVRVQWDGVYCDFTRQLAYMGRGEELLRRIEEFRLSLQGKTARYVRYCEMAAHAWWILGDLQKSLQIAEEGVYLKQQTGVDTDNDASHEYALALRDVGRIDEALAIFQKGNPLDEILENGIQNEQAQFYGNIGRALQLKGQHEQALALLRRSARMLLQDKGYISETNRGWAAFWIGEILEERGDYFMGFCASAAAAEYWTRCYPRKEKEARRRAASCLERVGDGEMMPTSRNEIIALYESWIEQKLRKF